MTETRQRSQETSLDHYHSLHRQVEADIQDNNK